MDYLGIFVFIALIACLGYFQWWALKTRPADLEAIKAYAVSRSLKAREIKRTSNYWRYWLRGNLLLSNWARIFVVEAEAPDGSRGEVHIAFDPLSRPRGLRVLRDTWSP